MLSGTSAGRRGVFERGREVPDVLLIFFLLRGLHASLLVLPPLPCNVDAVRVVPIRGQEFDLLGLGVLEDQLRESRALVGGEVVAFQEVEAGLHPG
jgi:hypothetical protein